MVYWFAPQLGEANPQRLALVGSLVFWWGWRLTYSWARGWAGLHHEDFRYRDLRAKTAPGAPSTKPSRPAACFSPALRGRRRRRGLLRAAGFSKPVGWIGYR